MKAFKYSVITGSLLAALSILSVYADSPVQADDPIYSTLTIEGNRVISVKTFKTREEQEKAALKEQERLNRITEKHRAKRKNQTRAEMLKGLTPIPYYPPVSETRQPQSEMFSIPLNRKLDLRLIEAYTRNYDKAKPGDIYVYADYADYTSKELLGEKDGTTAISAMIVQTVMRKGENKSFGVDVNVYYINPTARTISMSHSEDMKGIHAGNNETDYVFKLPKHQLQPGDLHYELAKLMYHDLTGKEFN